MIEFQKTEAAPKARYLEEIVGALPFCWDASDARDAIAQHDEKQMGNGPWNKGTNGFKFNTETGALSYPGDPAMKPWAVAKLPLTKETIYVYKCAWVCIAQEDGTFTVDRRD